MNTDTLLDTFVNKRALTVLKKNGYKTYNDIKSLTLEDFLKMDGMGEVTAYRLVQDIDDYRKEMYKELIIKTQELADSIGIEKALEVIEKANQ